MQIWPAIDLRGGKCVRLKQGDYSRETVYGDDPAEMARRWVAEGAQFLHLVDLDGARDGFWANKDAVERILAAVSVPCELGGGVRDEVTIRTLLDVGLSRLVIGTKALKEPDWFRKMCRKFPSRLAIGIDAKNGLVATDGWLETSQTSAIALAQQYDTEPVAAVIYTDIAKDGMLAGPNLDAMAEMQRAVDLPVIASGGVTTVADVRNLAEVSVAGCIIGRALYEGQLRLREALEAANNYSRLFSFHLVASLAQAALGTHGERARLSGPTPTRSDHDTASGPGYSQHCFLRTWRSWQDQPDRPTAHQNWRRHRAAQRD